MEKAGGLGRGCGNVGFRIVDVKMGECECVNVGMWECGNLKIWECEDLDHTNTLYKSAPAVDVGCWMWDVRIWIIPTRFTKGRQRLAFI